MSAVSRLGANSGLPRWAAFGQFGHPQISSIDKKMSTYAASWQITNGLLAEARALLSPNVVAANALDLKQFDEFLDANELGLAFDLLESIVYEDVQGCLPLLRLLKSAAAEMKLEENVTELQKRISTLEGPSTGR